MVLGKIGDALRDSKKRRHKMQAKIGKIDPVMKEKDKFERENPIVPVEDPNKPRPAPKPRVRTQMVKPTPKVSPNRDPFKVGVRARRRKKSKSYGSATY